MRTVPVNQSAGPLLEGCEPFLLISIVVARVFFSTSGGRRRARSGRPTCAWQAVSLLSAASLRRLTTPSIIHFIELSRELPLILLARGPEQNFVHVHVLWLAHRKGNCPRE